MQFISNGREYRIRFRYPEKSVAGIGSKVEAVVLQHLPNGEWEEILEGESRRSRLEPKPFSKEIGRKLALRRALFGEPRDFRVKVWDTYFARTGEYAQ